MKKTNKFKIVKRSDRRALVLRFWDDELETWVERSTGVGRRRDAGRMVDEIISLYQETKRSQLKEAVDYAADLTLWDNFRAKYDREKASKLSSPGVWKSAANLLEELIDPQSLSEVNAALLSRFESLMRKRKLKETSIGTYLKHIRAALGWAEDLEIIVKAPRVRLPKASRSGKHMKGRPLTTEEFERMISQTSKVVETGCQEFERALWLMWLTALRLDEAIRLNWDNEDGIHISNLTGRRPMLVFPASSHKQREDALVPLTPDAVEWLRKTPPKSRYGRVINLMGQRKPILSADRAGRIFSAIGEKARVVVEPKGKRNETGIWQPKYASAHDLRRSFGARWALRVMPAVLKQLMRHKSIETTMKYYVGHNAERTANEVWESYEANLGRAKGAGLGATEQERTQSTD